LWKIWTLRTNIPNNGIFGILSFKYLIKCYVPEFTSRWC